MPKKEYIERGAFLRYVKENAPFIYTVVEIMALAQPTADVVEKCENIPRETTEKCESDYPKDYSYGY